MPGVQEGRKKIYPHVSDDFGEFRTVFIVLQIFGLAPYNIGEDFDRSKRSKILVAYNIFMAFLVIANLFHSKRDPQNDLDYPNKTFLVSVAYDTVATLGNFYIFFVTINATIHTNIGMIVWFKLKKINVALREFKVEFDNKKMKYYMLFKMFLLFAVSTMFLASDILIHLSMGLHYTLNYWVANLFPLLYSVVVGIIFGSCTLCLFQRFWIVNEFLERFIKNYQEKPRHPEKFTGVNLRFYNEKILEEFLFERRHNNYISGNYKPQVEGKKDKKSKKTPLLVWMKNYDECFTRKQQDLLKDLKFLKNIYFQLFELTNDLNILFGTHFVFIFVTYFFGCTINLYFAITFHLRSFQSEQYVSACLWATVYLFIIIYLVSYSNIASNEVSCIQVINLSQ